MLEYLSWPLVFHPTLMDGVEGVEGTNAAQESLETAPGREAMETLSKANTLSRSGPLPTEVITLAAQLQHPNMPQEVGILLPTSQGPRRFMEALVERSDRGPPFQPDAILGLFLADPLINIAREQQRLREAGVRWIANLPSVELQDPDFARQLLDVELDQKRELAALAAFRDHGFKIAAVVADTDSARQAAALKPDLLFVLPRVADFAAGFPSPRQRRAAALEISKVLEAAGLAIPTLGLAQSSERDHTSQWPETLDGLILRPQLTAL
ncbi:hypothetical protein ACTL6U_16575 [Rhodovibrionaceae bacterium A322]